MLAGGATVEQVCRDFQIAESTWARWLNQYGGMNADDAKRLDELVRRLKIRAAEHGHSAEEEHREILRAALGAALRMPFNDLLLSMPEVGDDADFERSDDLGREIDW